MLWYLTTRAITQSSRGKILALRERSGIKREKNLCAVNPASAEPLGGQAR
jgi:hypothetical protein